MITRNDQCWCGSGKKWKKCHYPEDGVHDLSREYKKKYGIHLKTPQQIEKIREACTVTSRILHKICKKAVKGVTTDELNTYAMQLHTEASVIPAPLGYGHPPYPKAICTSLNDVICHGIPDNRPLQDGDIMNIDVSCILDGYFGDTSAMITVGDISEEKQRVVDVSYEALMESIRVCKPGARMHEIGDVIEAVAKKAGCSVVNQFVGHGVGIEFHEAPEVPHHKNRLQIPMAPGMIFTIEPMINAGRRSAMIDDDDWTARTVDGKPSAQWEHTVLITESGYEILTLPPEE